MKLVWQTHRVECEVSPHVAGRDPIEHSSACQRPEALGHDVEESSEQRHLGTNQVGEGNGRIDVSAADMTDGLDKSGSCQPETKGDMENIKGPGGPAESRAEPEEHKEHGAIKFCKHRPPKRHGPELPHGGKCKKKKKKELLLTQGSNKKLFLHSTNKPSQRETAALSLNSKTPKNQHAGVEKSCCVTSDSVIDSS